MADQWYVEKGGKKHGPFSTDHLKRLAAAGKIDRADLLWKDGMEKWVACGSAKGLFTAAPAAARPVAPPPHANPLDDVDADNPAAAFAGFEVPSYVPTPEEPPPIKPVESPTASYTPVKAARRMDYAGLGARFVAYFRDFQLIAIPLVIAMVLLIDIDRNDPKRLQILIIGLQPVVLILMVICGSLMESSRSGATFGKRAMGIRVADLEGRPIGLGRALLRDAARSIPLLILGSALIVLLTPRKQGAHDLAAGTVVVKV